MLKASLTIKGKTVDRTAPFAVNAVQAALAQNVAEVNANKGLDEVYFNSLPEDSLDAAAEVLELVPGSTSRERAVYKKDELSLRRRSSDRILGEARCEQGDGDQRDPDRVLPEQWDTPTRTTAPGSCRAGRRRADVYAKYGAPDDSLNENSMGGMGIRTQTWKMTRGKLRWFIFGDRANNGSYVLLKSSEIDEPGTPVVHDGLGTRCIRTLRSSRIQGNFQDEPVVQDIWVLDRMQEQRSGAVGHRVDLTRESSMKHMASGAIACIGVLALASCYSYNGAAINNSNYDQVQATPQSLFMKVGDSTQVLARLINDADNGAVTSYTVGSVGSGIWCTTRRATARTSTRPPTRWR